VAIWWADAVFDTGLSVLLIAVAGSVPIGDSGLVRLGSEYRLFPESLEIERGLIGGP
jgi:hypothetical protein